MIKTSAITNYITFESTILFKNQLHSPAFLLSDFISEFKEMEEQIEQYSHSLSQSWCLFWTNAPALRSQSYPHSHSNSFSGS